MKINIIPLVILVVILFAIGAMYTMKVTPKTYLTLVYLYVMLGIVGIMIVANYFPEIRSTLTIIIITIIAISVISVIYFANPLISNIGYVIFIILMGMTITSIFHTGQSLTMPIIITTILFFVFTAFVFMMPTEILFKIAGAMKYLVSALCAVIVVQLVMIFTTKNPIYYKIMYWTVLILMIGFLMGNTSIALLQSKSVNNEKQTQINYPRDSVSLLLTYLNMFTSVVGISST